MAADVVSRVRTGDLRPAQKSAAHMLATHRDPSGMLLPSRTAAVELLNVLRPTVAVAVYVVFAAHALDSHPQWRARLAAEGDTSEDEWFIEEVRRTYPFFPAVMGVVRDSFSWGGCRFHEGRRVLLDLYGTNHDARVWDRPHDFDPERFAWKEPDRFAFVPQGGGDPEIHHRCPGEPVATRLMQVAVDRLVRRLRYTPVRPGGPIDRTRLPACPATPTSS